MEGDAVKSKDEEFWEWLTSLLKDGSPVDRCLPRVLSRKIGQAMRQYSKLGLSKEESIKLKDRKSVV